MCINYTLLSLSHQIVRQYTLLFASHPSPIFDMLRQSPPLSKPTTSHGCDFQLDINLIKSTSFIKTNLSSLKKLQV